MTILDHWVIGTDSYVFVNLFTSPSTNSSRLLKTTGVNNGTTFTTTPLTPAQTILSGQLNGSLAYVASNSSFYYVSTAGIVYQMTTAGGIITRDTAGLLGRGLTDMALYNYRLVAWGGTDTANKKRLFYSNTDLTLFASTWYYEFSGTILNVLPRTNDLLVICDTGVFSLVGVLGSSVTIQLIVPQNNILEGMDAAVIVGRNAYFLDQRLSGAPDGRLYQLYGATVQPVGTMNINDVVGSQVRGVEQAIIQVINDGRIVIQLRNGVCYAETVGGVWTRLTSPINDFISSSASKVRIGKAGPGSYNEYYLVATAATNTKMTLTRYIHNISTIVELDTNFDYSTTPTGSTITATGNVTLAEYWHSKPFTVKEMFVEFYVRDGYTAQLNAGIIPTGIIDLYSSYNGSASVTATEPLVAGTNNTNNSTVVQRIRPNNAPKGFGIKPYLEFSNMTLTRVILNCED
jgi:hypothetical protein